MKLQIVGQASSLTSGLPAPERIAGKMSAQADGKPVLLGITSLLLLLAAPVMAARPFKDTPFLQDVSVRISANAELDGAGFRKVAVNRDGIVYVLTDRGVARLFENTLALDHSFRPLAALRPRDVTMQSGELFYLYDDQFLANGWAGKVKVRLPAGRFQKFALAENGAALLAGPANVALARDGQLTELDPAAASLSEARLFAWRNDLFVLTDRQVFRLEGQRWKILHEGTDLTTLGFRGNEMFVGTKRGFHAQDLTTGRETLARQTRLPVTHITCIVPRPDGVWAGTPRGMFLWTPSGEIRYYASRRWLVDDSVIDIALDRDGSVFALTGGGLSKIAFRKMTLAEKSMHYERKIRQRHMRYGLCSELRLLRPGDISSAEMIDTDNDGSWSAYYMASQAFRYAATGDPQAHANAWETFEALERLESINGLNGFPSRTIERKGFKFSDPDRWRTAPDADWEWKGTTSSDEFTDHTFGYAVLWECAAKTPAEKQRIAALYDKIIGHIVRNNWYLIDSDGQPTLWGRWHPEYVNWFPPSIVDRKLNSVEIIAGLQFAHRITGKALYREKAFELFQQHGYLTNILSSLKLIAPTTGFIHQGNDMGDEWNHSDDQLAFDTYWTLHRYAFNDTLRRRYAGVVADHFELEKHERIPIWNVVTAMTGAKDFDLEGALWTLRRFPLDLISWTVRNSHREDITKLPKNFRSQQLKELLPPGERRISRWNTHPFIMDGGDGGRIEFAGDEFLLPYWMARYHKLIR
jgi:hypothetical protein